MLVGRRWNYLSSKRTFATKRWTIGEQPQNMKYAGRCNIYRLERQIILMCPSLFYPTDELQTSHKRELITRPANRLNWLILLIKRKRLQQMGGLSKQLRWWCARTVVAGPGQCCGVDWQVPETCAWMCTAGLWQQALSNTMSTAGLTFVGGKGKCYDVTRRDGTEK